MKHLLAILLAVTICVTASAQTIRTLGYNTTNGQIIANTGTNVLTFTNSITIDANGDAMRFLVNAQEIAFYSGAAGENILTLPIDDVPVFSQNYYWNDPSVRSSLGFSTNLTSLWTATNAAAARSAVGLPLPALTNISNVTMMRALAGSTNTNQPFSGTINIQDFSDNTITITVSNGIITGWVDPY